MSNDEHAPWKDEELLRQKYHGEGYTINELADLWNTTYDTIRYYKDKYDIENSTIWTGVDPEHIESLYWDEGLSLLEIGERYDTEDSYVLKFMDEHDIPRRTPDHEKGDAWKDAGRLRRLYWNEGLTLEEIGDKLGCSASTAGEWMERHDIEREAIPEEKPPMHRISPQGYEQIKTKVDQTSYSVNIHRLVAIAEGKLPASELRDSSLNVHHKNGVRWDNRPENLEVMSKSEHHAHHYEEREIGDDGRFKS